MLTARSGRLRAARRLARRTSRAEHRLFLAEGVKALTEALLLPDCVVEVFATADATATYAAVRDAVVGAGLPWYEAEDAAVAQLSGTVSPQGLVSVCRFLDVELSTLVAEVHGAGALAVCVETRDPGNAGTIIRTADAAGCAGVVLAGSSVDPYNDKVVRATVGSLFHLPLALASDPVEVVTSLREAGFRVLATDARGETDLFEATSSGLLAGRTAWLFGNEAHGLPEHVAELADHRVAIPILGRAESLNLATAAAVCLYAGASVSR